VEVGRSLAGWNWAPPVAAGDSPGALGAMSPRRSVRNRAVPKLGGKLPPRTGRWPVPPRLNRFVPGYLANEERVTKMIPCSKKAHDRNQMVPEGQPRIAQRFNAGLATGFDKVPKGRLKSSELVQPSLRDLTFHHWQPSVETLGHFHPVPPGHHFVRCSKTVRPLSCRAHAKIS
jgi:hypothetical protein